MTLEVLPDAEAAAREAAERIAAEAWQLARRRGRYTLALSGGETPRRMLELLARADLPWERVVLFQVDERVAEVGHPDRNWTGLRESLLRAAPLPPSNVHPMPVEAEDLEAGARAYAAVLAEHAGSPPVLDRIHLGLGADGHTASLLPGDSVVEATDRDVAVTARPYRGRIRMTLTLPMLNRARALLWLVTGDSKRAALERLLRGDPKIPAGCVDRERALVLADRAAAGC